VNKQGGTFSILLQVLALEIHQLSLKWNITIHFAHIPRVENVNADKLSLQLLRYSNEYFSTTLPDNREEIGEAVLVTPF
jgi:hypothetical protein